MFLNSITRIAAIATLTALTVAQPDPETPRGFDAWDTLEEGRRNRLVKAAQLVQDGATESDIRVAIDPEANAWRESSASKGARTRADNVNMAATELWQTEAAAARAKEPPEPDPALPEFVPIPEPVLIQPPASTFEAVFLASVFCQLLAG